MIKDPEGHDVKDSPFVGTSGKYNQLQIRTANYSGTASGPTSRFNNRAVIDYIKDDAGTPGSRPASIPWLPYYSSKGVPERGEIAPQ